MFIYAIGCANNKFYIGKTTLTPYTLFIEHLSGNGNEWTTKYKPTHLLESYQTDNEFEDDVLTKKYMMLYGIENVRGGSYTKLILEDWQMNSLEHEFSSMRHLCYKCGNLGHFAQNCGNNKKYSDYLKQFENTIDTHNEIQKLCKLRETIDSSKNVIAMLKTISLTFSQGPSSSKNNISRTIEICPTTIKKYYREIKEYQKSNQQFIGKPGMSIEADICEHIRNHILRNPLYEITRSNNFIEIMYNIYVKRVSLEKELNTSIRNTIPTEILGNSDFDYDNIILILNDMIESLYEKYVTLL